MRLAAPWEGAWEAARLHQVIAPRPWLGLRRGRARWKAQLTCSQNMWAPAPCPMPQKKGRPGAGSLRWLRTSTPTQPTSHTNLNQKQGQPGRWHAPVWEHRRLNRDGVRRAHAQNITRYWADWLGALGCGLGQVPKSRPWGWQCITLAPGRVLA